MSTNIGNVGHEADLLNAAFDATGVKWHNRAEALAAFKECREIISENGQLFTRYDSEILPLSDALLRYAYDSRNHVDGRSLPRQGVGTSRPGLASKADYVDRKSKLEAIEKFGLEWWEKLPLTGIGSKEVETMEDFRKLPLAEKNRLITADKDYVYKLKPTPNLPQPGQARINHEALERQKAIRPASGKR